MTKINSSLLPMFNIYKLNRFQFSHRKYELVPHQDEIVRKHIQWHFPYLADIEKKTVLAVINTHPAFDGPEPMPPNVIPVGGLQIQEPKKLPDVTGLTNL